MHKEFHMARRYDFRTILRSENCPLLVSLAVIILAVLYVAALFILAQRAQP